MEKTGVVSVWIGRGTDRLAFGRMLEYTITEDGLGEFHASPFCREFGIARYDPDQFGGRFFPKVLSFSLMFREAPFGEAVAADCAAREPSNCYVLLCDFEYDGHRVGATIQGFVFEFIGVYPNPETHSDLGE